ncbi:hypothetical protein [Cryobacterium sp. TMT1-66-1]|uniref:hypothetical protein n=1 Tax=Cryobacterium sp. TMT1-66-1 TaxID=1259242 RepID=UPI00106CF1E5|nr:hypothetical protein [Cryobacterium sp. TMT1-66-1]TFD06188.1 hypothetical protein E3T29_10875 [Cryobacterium sp. TMT1-66-1]
MSHDLVTVLCHLGHVATSQQLAGIGASRRSVKSAVDSGLIRHVAHGVFSCAHLDAPTLTALQVGGRVDCLTRLSQLGIWCGIARPGLHLRLRPHHHQRRLAPGASIHWSRAFHCWAPVFEVSPFDAVLQALSCLDDVDALACLESALFMRFITEDDLEELLRLAPDHLRALLRLLDRGAQSGFETFSRVGFIRAGFRVATQFYVTGAGRVDMLVNGCVGIETDGEEWHGPERFLPDRSKDREVERQGIRVLRLARPHIFDTWPTTLETVRRMVNDAEDAAAWKRRS